MNVDEEVDLGNGHTIEFGKATWDANQTSVRNRYATRTGGFSPRSSSEIPIRDIAPLAIETLKRGLMTPQEAKDVIEAANDLLRRSS